MNRIRALIEHCAGIMLGVRRERLGGEARGSGRREADVHDEWSDDLNDSDPPYDDGSQ